MKIAFFIQRLDAKHFSYYLYATLVSIVLLVSGMHYFIYTKSFELAQEISQLQKLTKKTASLVSDFNYMQQEEERLLGVLKTQQGFHIKIYFEQLCKDKNLNTFLEQGAWDVSTNELNDQMYEECLKVGFKRLTTELLVALLAAIDKQDLLCEKFAH